MQEIILSHFKKTNTSYGIGTEPFAIYFVYCSNGKSFCIKGMANEVVKYVMENFDKAIIYYSFWRDGKSRGNWTSIANTGVFFEQIRKDPENYNSRLIYQVTVINNDKRNIYYMRRIPRKWLPIYLNNAVTTSVKINY